MKTETAGKRTTESVKSSPKASAWTKIKKGIESYEGISH